MYTVLNRQHSEMVIDGQSVLRQAFFEDGESGTAELVIKWFATSATVDNDGDIIEEIEDSETVDYFERCYRQTMSGFLKP